MFVPQEINALLTERGNDRGKYPLGVYLDKKSGKYKAQCNKNGKRVYLGRFSCKKEAHKAYLAFKAKYMVELAKSSSIHVRAALLNRAKLLSEKAAS